MKEKYIVRSRENRRVRVQTPVEGKSATQQNFQKECDANFIMKRYKASGLLPNSQSGPPQYGEQPAETHFEAQVAVKAIESAFEELTPEQQELVGSPEGLLDAALTAPESASEEPAGASVALPEGGERSPPEGSEGPESDVSSEGEPAT